MLKTQNTKIWHLINNEENLYGSKTEARKQRFTWSSFRCQDAHQETQIFATLFMSESDHKGGMSIEMEVANKS